jgi:hypothetical protein
MSAVLALKTHFDMTIRVNENRDGVLAGNFDNGVSPIGAIVHRALFKLHTAFFQGAPRLNAGRSSFERIHDEVGH